MIRRAAVVALGAAAGATLLGGVASAFVLGRVAGTGSGTATAAAPKAVTLTVDAAPAAALYPGGPGADVTFTVANANTVPITLTALTAGTPVVSGAPGCTDPALSVTVPASFSLTVAAGKTSAPVTLPAALVMGSGAQNACQGATFAVPLTATGRL